MVGSLAGEGYHVFCDNWFMSPRLGFCLLDLQTLCTGTLRKNRGAPRELVRRHQEKHESTFYRKREAVVVRFTDKKAGKPAKDVYVLSRAAACHVTQRTRHLRGSAVEEFHIPSVIDQYNGMNGVDLSDQSLHEYNIARKQYKWFKKLGLHLLHRMLFNAFLLFGREERSNMRFLNFSMEAERHLTKVGEDGRPKRLGRQPQVPPPSLSVTVLHWIQKIPATDATTKPQKRCRICFRCAVTKKGRWHRLSRKPRSLSWTMF